MGSTIQTRCSLAGWRLRVLHACRWIVTSLMALTHGVAEVAEPGTVYFFSTETSIDNYGSLKAEFDRYLSAHGPYVFQPFNSREVFDRFVEGRTNCVVVLSSWHFRRLREQVHLDPVMIGLLRQKATQKRVLCASRNAGGLQALKGERIAAAGTTEFARSVLERMVDGEQAESLAKASLVTVPKDIDALMAVSFRMARAALTAEESLAKFAAINPRQHAQLQVLATSEEIPMPVVATPGNSEVARKLVDVLQRMSEGGEGQRLLRMLGFDGLRPCSVDEVAAMTAAVPRGGAPP